MFEKSCAQEHSFATMRVWSNSHTGINMLGHKCKLHAAHLSAYLDSLDGPRGILPFGVFCRLQAAVSMYIKLQLSWNHLPQTFRFWTGTRYAEAEVKQQQHEQQQAETRHMQWEQEVGVSHYWQFNVDKYGNTVSYA